MRLLPEIPVGRPSFNLAEEEIATVIDLLCRGAADARALVSAGMLEVPVTILVRKSMLRLKRQLGLTNLEVGGELELLNVEDDEAQVQGRIDIVLRFLHQFGDEEAYLGVECKRVRPHDSSLNSRYISQGVERFVTGQYAAGHFWGLMLGYVLQLPHGTLPTEIDDRMRKRYGEDAKLDSMDVHPDALHMQVGKLAQQGAGPHTIRLIHILVDMSTAALSPGASFSTP